MTGVDPDRPLLARILGPAFDDLPAAIRAAHTVADCQVLHGRVCVDGAETSIGRFIARLIGLPNQTHDAPITVEMRRDGDREVWSRRVDGRQFVSRLGPCRIEPARGTERIGPITFVIAYGRISWPRPHADRREGGTSAAAHMACTAGTSERTRRCTRALHI